MSYLFWKLCDQERSWHQKNDVIGWFKAARIFFFTLHLSWTLIWHCIILGLIWGYIRHSYIPTTHLGAMETIQTIIMVQAIPRTQTIIMVQAIPRSQTIIKVRSILISLSKWRHRMWEKWSICRLLFIQTFPLNAIRCRAKNGVLLFCFVLESSIYALQCLLHYWIWFYNRLVGL